LRGAAPQEVPVRVFIGIDDDWIELEVAKRTRVRYLKGAVSSLTGVEETADGDERIEATEDDVLEEAEAADDAHDASASPEAR
jgi:DNA/RNA-binding domain of Phe-tRNA-synthetase-like protein